MEDLVAGGTTRVIWASEEPFGEIISKVVKIMLHKQSVEFHTAHVSLKINFVSIAAGGFFIFMLI